MRENMSPTLSVLCRMSGLMTGDRADRVHQRKGTLGDRGHIGATPLLVVASHQESEEQALRIGEVSLAYSGVKPGTSSVGSTVCVSIWDASAAAFSVIAFLSRRMRSSFAARCSGDMLASRSACSIAIIN